MSTKNEIERRKKSTAGMSTLAVGALTGAGIGLMAALLLRRRAEQHRRESTLTMGESIKLGLLVFGLLRAISALGGDDD